MPEFPLRLAVASKDGQAISEHFGHATRFAVYAVDPEVCRLLEQREVEHYCLGNSASQSAMAGILETIRDCQAVFVARIGDGPTEKLRAIGVQAVAGYAWEPIEAALLDYARRTAAGEVPT
ncbi:NifB/NifX family molybdenum-iron cluster-binding protein [Pseudomonas sp. GCM10022188]|uniref:NifB/NifX family molybdenum-iron cluster-binding protein n=1 Tax=Pseudomonas TaxID=286 RepID=UPI001E47BCF4|nr:NifB/NifX family molybdenum-iron cluster-binding protein [Pseudomonas oryzagri]MCC6075788.1 dinitrogenase iron-molybdenum cofactor biosynthesis protein [Pseudomonas oryzagri]